MPHILFYFKKKISLHCLQWQTNLTRLSSPFFLEKKKLVFQALFHLKTSKEHLIISINPYLTSKKCLISSKAKKFSQIKK
jgi:hypothetical protein